MADPTPPSGNAAAPTPAPAAASSGAAYKAAAPNPALRMMGIPYLPKKLPSRNWMIFFTITGSLSAAIIYDKREKKRATARWAKAVSHLAREPISDPTQLPRKLTIFLESPPGDGLRVAQDHFTEYIKPILSASGLDWEFVQGRKQGDIRAAVAERIRRTREPEAVAQTKDEVIEEVRKKNNTPQWHGARGDIVIGRHTWKEYVRGIHEGWLGPLTPPPPEPEVVEKKIEEVGASEGSEGEKQEPKPEEKPEQKPERPPQPLPYNTTNDYPTSAIPMLIPAEFSPSSPIGFPHVLGFSNTFIRLRRFLNRRYLADDIGREVAAVCLASAREYREDADLSRAEQQTALEHEEKDWVKSVWKDEKPKEDDKDATASTAPPPEKIWASPMVLDPRIAMRMRRFEIQPEEVARANEIVVPEEEVEGWIKGSFRSLYRWAISKPEPNPSWPDE
ncbi:mitochondrial import inner membrane translocase subunit Tim54 [Annulohypoxylon maeteangense]|uniref:mitochondrial import inner membrane translocase subunit Tim54 n=1 Tax=Annulohypoxylon maeteangense TaxID=1927788 RepID=UPI002007F35D|nr:mitochondrial import inner membrane translocase subunit Tim54 [Annulohypoxylon maeteangense]KAI0882894.1 mitochondrial import inner membrane translocase subunit Tim54 [Annulohypoxylon maeteangense]